MTLTSWDPKPPPKAMGNDPNETKEGVENMAGKGKIPLEGATD
jgi:hypothetical protein